MTHFAKFALRKKANSAKWRFRGITRIEKQLKSGAFQDKFIYADGSEPEPKLVKTKRFDLRPMSVNEAMEEFGLVGHSFYVFLDEATNTVKVLYLRDDGNVGLIDPVF